MALRDELEYSKAWVSGQGIAELPAYATTEGDARNNLQIQHTEARTKINEIVNAIKVNLNDNNDNTIPTTKAVKTAIAAAAVQADWSEADSSEPDYIKNKPNLATVATSGSYNDLSNKPSIPSAQVQSNWTQSNSSAVDYIKNKPSLATVATSGSYTDLSSKPSIPTVSGTSGKIAKFTGSNAVGNAFALTVSTEDPSGGSNGDIWIKYTN